jgi:hypothetical protein
LWCGPPSTSTSSWRLAARTAGSGVRAGIVHVEQPGDGLLLQPFLGIALVDAGPAGELRRRGRPAQREGAVQPEPVAEVDVEQVDRTEYGPDETPDKGVPPWAAL